MKDLVEKIGKVLIVFFWKFHFSAEKQDLYSKIDDLFHFETMIQIEFYNRF